MLENMLVEKEIIMINIRQNVFETNSSSSHSFSLKFKKKSGDSILNTITPDENGMIVFTGGNFTKSEFSIKTPQQKANLIAANIVVYGNDELKGRFEKVVKEHTGATEVVYDIRTMAANGSQPNTFYSPRVNSAYSYYYDEETDEESEIYFSDILADNDLMKSFIFSDSSYIVVGITECWNDN